MMMMMMGWASWAQDNLALAIEGDLRFSDREVVAKDATCAEPIRVGSAEGKRLRAGKTEPSNLGHSL